jgi:hypothetical protein
LQELAVKIDKQNLQSRIAQNYKSILSKRIDGLKSVRELNDIYDTYNLSDEKQARELLNKLEKHENKYKSNVFNSKTTKIRKIVNDFDIKAKTFDGKVYSTVEEVNKVKYEHALEYEKVKQGGIIKKFFNFILGVLVSAGCSYWALNYVHKKGWKIAIIVFIILAWIGTFMNNHKSKKAWEELTNKGSNSLS